MQRPRALIVDGDKGFRRMLMLALEEDYDVFEAKDRDSALQYLEEAKRPHIILLELFLPPRPDHLDEGFTILRRFKKTAPQVKIIVITTIENKETVVKTQELGVDRYIVKPFATEELKRAISETISRPAPPELRLTLRGLGSARHWRDTAGMQAGFEKRKYWRVKGELPVGYIILEGESSVSREERTIDLSPGGIMFSMDHRAALFELFGLEICVNSRPRIVRAIGEVRWVKRMDDCEKYRIGIQFLHITHEDRERIGTYIYNKESRIRSVKENQN